MAKRPNIQRCIAIPVDGSDMRIYVPVVPPSDRVAPFMKVSFQEGSSMLVHYNTDGRPSDIKHELSAAESAAINSRRKTPRPVERLGAEDL